MAKVKCPRCFHVNPDGQNECEQCHAPLPRIHIEAKPGPPSATASAITFQQGQLVANRYTVMNIIGRGGMGCIYKVHDRILGEEVALKTLLPQLVQDKLVVERFFNEARIARKLSHPHIVRVHDIGVAGETIYISMEFIRGHSLRALLEQCGPNQRLPLARILVVFEELCAALDYAHQYTVHRDIKPENVMIDEQGRVKLMDFGISKLMADTRMTGASVVMGTPFYMAPEQFRNSRDVDARADIYSVGVMLYEVLTGVMPTGVPKPASEMRSGMPPGLDAVVMKCVEPDPANRYATAAELRQALIPLRGAVAGAPAKAQKQPKSGRAFSARRVAGTLLALTAVAAAGAGSMYAGALMPPGGPAEVSTPAAPSSAASGLESYETVVARLKSTAESRSGDRHAAAVALGSGFWERAQNLDAAGDRAGALDFAGKALQCFAAAVMQPEGMSFIPPGETVVDGQHVAVDGFLIDDTEVTVGAFRNFAQRIDGGWPVPTELASLPDDYPAANVTYYDALAFAAGQGKQMPTVEQWARAAYGSDPKSYPWGGEWMAEQCACLDDSQSSGMPGPVARFETDRNDFGIFDLAGGVSEWTSSIQNSQTGSHLPDFGDRMIVRGGNFNAAEVPLTESFTWLYEERSPNIGFRCVLPVPSKPDAAARVLDR